MRESKIESTICKEAKHRGYLIYKFTSPGNTGVPDRLLLRNGKVFFVEFKSEHGLLTSIQKFQIDAIRNQNIKVFVISSLTEGYALLDSLDA